MSDKPQRTMHNLLTAEHLKSVVEQQWVPADLRERLVGCDAATIRMGALMTGMEVGPRLNPPLTAMDVMRQATPLLLEAAGLQTRPL